MKSLLISFLVTSFLSTQAQDVLKLKVELAEITSTEKIYNFITENMVGIIGWQFQMEFDGTKMKFKEIRNPVQSSQNSHNFNESAPGLLRSVWLDYDLQSDDFPDSSVLFQLVFETLEPEGAPLCFLESQEYFEFIIDEGSGTFSLAEIIISDDCYQGFSIFLESTSTELPAVSDALPIKDVFLSSSGSLSFTSLQDQELHFSVMDMNGKVLTTIDHRTYTQGRNTVQCRNVVPGVYLVKVKGGDGEGMIVKVFAN